LIVITDTAAKHRPHVDLATLAVAGGADAIQYRDKHSSMRQVLQTARHLRDICHRANVALIINDRIDVAMAVDADGVHLGQNDVPIAVARELLGADKLIGGSASTLEEARQVEQDGADYIGCGHIFPTQSKDKPYPARGTDFLREVCADVKIPVIAIGGITIDNAPQVLAAGASGIAVIGTVSHAPDPREATRKLSTLIHAREQAR
jgi:thiamine-phosphate pyrophosphorylase